MCQGCRVRLHSPGMGAPARGVVTRVLPDGLPSITIAFPRPLLYPDSLQTPRGFFFFFFGFCLTCGGAGAGRPTSRGPLWNAEHPRVASSSCMGRLVLKDLQPV